MRRFYDETDEKIGVIAGVALDAMEFDAYWAVLEQIDAASHGDMGTFAASLEQFGLLELSTIGVQAQRRRAFLEKLDELIANPRTLEAEIHKALEANLWVLGRSYSMLASNETLGKVLKRVFGSAPSSDRAARRPDLLLAESSTGDYVLFEFKRPSHPIGRDDLSQAEKYRDDLTPVLAGKRIEIVMLGNGVAQGVVTSNLAKDVKVLSFVGVVSGARTELEWIISSLAR